MAQSYLIVGAGNMGGALLSGWLSASLVSARNVVILDPNPGVEAVYAIERGARHVVDTESLSKPFETVLLAVKPQMFPQVRRQLAELVSEETIVISIMAGVSTKSLKEAFPKAAVVRAMPNTPAAIGQGITAYTADPDSEDGVIEAVETLLKASGKVIRVEDDTQINAVTALSGSGPAYVFHLCEAMMSAGQSIGLSHDAAMQLARETVIGASALFSSDERSATELREAVTSPGGTTQAALDVLMSHDGLEPLMREAIRAAFDRAKALSR